MTVTLRLNLREKQTASTSMPGKMARAVNVNVKHLLRSEFACHQVDPVVIVHCKRHITATYTLIYCEYRLTAQQWTKLLITVWRVSAYTVTSSQWRMAILDHLGLWNPWIDWAKIWHHLLRPARDPACKNWWPSDKGGAVGIWAKLSSRDAFLVSRGHRSPGERWLDAQMHQKMCFRVS